MPDTAAGTPAPEPYDLPDFCAPRMVLVVVLIAELVAVLVATARLGRGASFWIDLGRSSLLLLWIGLGSAAALCYLRAPLSRLGVARGAAAALALLLAVTAAVSEAAWWNADRLGATPAAGSHAAFLLGNLAVCLIVSGIVLRYFYVTAAWRRNVLAEARARIDVLQARIHPHFLYNSMNTIAALTRSDPVQAERAVEDLADLFRASLSEARHVVSFADELEVTRTYQRIEQLRLGSRLRVEWRIATVPPVTLVPGMCLQPLLENAIHHGVERLRDGGTVQVEAALDGAFLVLTVVNPLPDDTTPAHAGHRSALDNIRERIALLYEGAATLTTGAADGHFTARLRLPSGGPEPQR